MTQFLFDFKKILTEKTNYFGLVALFVLFIIPILFARSDKEEIENQQLEYYQSNLAIASQAEKSMESIPEASEALKEVKESNQLLDNLVSTYLSDTDSNKLEAEYQYEKNQLRDLEDGTLSGVPVIEQKKTVTFLEYLIDNNMSKIYGNENYIPALNFLEQNFKGVIPNSLILIICSLLFANIYSFEKRKNTISFFNILPKKLNHIAINKVTVTTLFVLITFILSVFLAFLFILLKNGLGDLNYPIVYSTNGVEVSIMTVGVFLVKTVVLIIFFILFLSLLSFFISLFTGSVLVNAGILVALILLSESQILTAEPFSNFSHFLPFSYVNTSILLTHGSSYEPLSNASITFTNGVICLMIYTLIFGVASFSAIAVKNKI